jgi:sigma-E factor negative regulatory protein RseB
VALEPRDDYRYTRLIWIDKDSKLPLKLDVLNEEGQSIEQMVFTTLTIAASIANQDLEPSVQAGKVLSRINHREPQSLDTLKWTLQDVPEGFQIVSYHLAKRPPAYTPVEHLLLSDGFTSVSVYIEKKEGAAVSRERQAGSINIDTVYLNGYSITVMGEVPAKTVQKIARGVRVKQEARGAGGS